MPEPIRPGSIVQLKSGGPTMTVNLVENYEGVISVYCDWFVHDKPPWKKEDAVFPATSLKVLEP
jgi:uncharacterized protein YodC (DUF2158 family)